MGLKIVCHGCGNTLYEGFDLMPFFKLRSELNGKLILQNPEKIARVFLSY